MSDERLKEFSEALHKAFDPIGVRVDDSFLKYSFYVGPETVDDAMDAADADLYAWNLENDDIPGGATPLDIPS